MQSTASGRTEGEQVCGTGSVRNLCQELQVKGTTSIDLYMSMTASVRNLCQ